jgi:hypothetical protein
MLIGEFLIMLAAVLTSNLFGGYFLINFKSVPINTLIIFYVLLIFAFLGFGVAYKYLAEKYERNEL